MNLGVVCVDVRTGLQAKQNAVNRPDNNWEILEENE